MAQTAPSLEQLIARLDSLDAGDRLAAVEALQRYASHRKVTQAVFLLRNDPDRRVREAARELLAEADRRTSASLSLSGQASNEAEEYLNDLLNDLKAADPTDRVTALKVLRTMDDPRAVAAVDRMRKDGNRIVRMLAEEATQSRKAAEARPSVSAFEGNVMVASPVSETPRKEWRERTAGRLGPELVPWLGLAYLATGLPFAVTCLWLWLGRQGAFDPAGLGFLPAEYAPQPSHFEMVGKTFAIPNDPLSLSIAFAVGAFQTLGGLGLLLRFESGRKAILLFHAALFLFGMLLPGVLVKLLPGLVSAVIVYYLTRPAIVATFRGAAAPEPAAKKANYGDMERKVW